jgi:CO/xanthine dehydrogenase Mo-binding subunit
VIVAQTQSAINYGLAMAMTSKITLTNGKVDQNNFGTPGIAPAIANAIFRKTGKMARTLPFSDAFA